MWSTPDSQFLLHEVVWGVLCCKWSFSYGCVYNLEMLGVLFLFIKVPTEKGQSQTLCKYTNRKVEGLNFNVIQIYEYQKSYFWIPFAPLLVDLFLYFYEVRQSLYRVSWKRKKKPFPAIQFHPQINRWCIISE